MKIEYINRFGKTFYLHTVRNQKGSLRYVMKRSEDGAISEIPDGYEICEDVNGVVSIRKVVSQLIREAEAQLVRSKLVELGLRGYRVGIKDKYLTVYEPEQNEETIRDYLKTINDLELKEIEHLASFLPPHHPVAEKVLELIERKQSLPNDKKIRKMLESSRVSPILRFILQNKKKRIFRVERMTFRGEGGWRDLHDFLPLQKAVIKYLRHLGKESFFDLC
jgi:hypothetical protein